MRKVRPAVREPDVPLTQFLIRLQRPRDGMIHATALCDYFQVHWKNFVRLKRNQAFILCTAEDLGYHPDDLIKFVIVGPPDDRGIWVHPQIAIELARWASPVFAREIAQGVIRGVPDWLIQFKKLMQDCDRQ